WIEIGRVRHREEPGERRQGRELGLTDEEPAHAEDRDQREPRPQVRAGPRIARALVLEIVEEVLIRLVHPASIGARSEERPIIHVHLLFFAQARERAGRAAALLELPDGARVRDALAAAEALHPDLAALRPHLAVAVNQRLATSEDALPDGAELALLPPVSGGAAPARARATTRARRSAGRAMPAAGLRVLPATSDRWADVERLFGPRGACAGCWCMYPRLSGAEFRAGAGEGNRRRLQRLVREGPPPGLLGYLDGEAVAWCALAPREAYPRLEHSRTLARVDDRPVWSIVCFFVARPFRRRGLTVEMLGHAARYARERGARVLEGYPVDPRSGKTADAFAWWGVTAAFLAAGFREVARRSPTHPIVRLELGASRARSRAAAKPSRG
ncbi:MAG: GNAT family N-acetyltransferase, partial [Candidatus Eisenbacteria bacterium]